MGKFYAVQVGLSGPNVYKTWAECKSNVNGVPGAKFKSFDCLDEAEEFAYGKNKKSFKFPVDVVVYTDGSYTDETLNGYAAVFLDTELNLLRTVYGPTSKDCKIRNIGGEIEAAEIAIKKAIEMGFKHIEIRHDYEGVGAWGTNDWKANGEDTISYSKFVKKARESIEISFTKVKGHSDDIYNDMADHFAGLGAALKEEIDC